MPLWALGLKGTLTGRAYKKCTSRRCTARVKAVPWGHRALGALGRDKNPQGATGTINFTTSAGATAPPKRYYTCVVMSPLKLKPTVKHKAFKLRRYRMVAL
jgi:hypothetical protein